MKSEAYPRLYLWLVSHRRGVFVTAALLALACAAISARFGMEEDILGILPQGDRVVDDYKYTLKKFRQIDRAYVDVGITNADSEALGRAADVFYARLATNDGLAHISYRIELGNQRQIISLLTGSLPNLFTEDDARQLSEKVKADSTREYLTVMRRKLSGPEGMVLKEVVAADPVGMSALVLPKVLPLMSGLGGAHVEDGRLLSSNGCHILVVAEPKCASSDSRQSAVIVGDMLNAAREVETDFPGTHVALTGGHRMALDNSRLIRRDSVLCIIIAANAMSLLCFLAYRRRWLATVTFVPALFGTLVAGAVLVLVEKHLSAIAVGLASMALGITVDYGIYVVYHLDNAATGRDSAGKIIARLVLPSCLGALTIISAFIVLAFSPMTGYRQLGIFGAVGVLMSAAFALLVLPLIVPLPKRSWIISPETPTTKGGPLTPALSPSEGGREKTNVVPPRTTLPPLPLRGGEGRGEGAAFSGAQTPPPIPPLRFTTWMDAFHAWQKRRRPVLWFGVLALTVVCLVGIKNLKFEGDIRKLNGITPATRDDDAIINRVWSQVLEMTLVIARGRTLDEALALNDHAATLLARHPNAAEVYSLSAICPSGAVQRENIRRWQAFWTPLRQASLRATLQQIGGELGFRPGAFEPFWNTIQGEPALITPESFRGTPLEQALAERIASGTNDFAVSTVVKLNDRSKVDQLRAALPEIIVVDGQDFAQHIAWIARKDMRIFALCTAAAVGVIAFFALGSIEVAFATLLPIALGLLWTLGLMGLLGLQINMMNSVFVIFVIGMGEDYSVFLATSKLDVWRGRPPRISPTSASVLISAATTIIGFAVLAFAKHPVLFSMGTTVLLGMASAFVATLVITPACMDLLLFRPPPTGAPRWWHLLGTAHIALSFALIQVFVYFIQRPALHLLRAHNIPDRLRAMTARLTRWALYVLPFGRLKFKNFSAKTFSPPGIVISNHQSAVDVVLFVAWAPTVRQTASKRVFDEPYLGLGCKILGHVMVEPGRPQATLQRCRQRLDEGASVHFYPEATRSADGWVRRFHRGAFELAIELKREILPIVLCDTLTGVARDAFWIEPYRIVVCALPRLTPETFDYSQGVVALMGHCERIIREALQKELDQVNTPRILRRKVRRLYRYQGRYTEQFVFWKLLMDRMFPALDKVTPRNGLILDLGCGLGLATHWLAQCTDSRRLIGVDFDANKIRIARQTAPNHPRIRFLELDILEMDYPPCDAILLLDVLHYWRPEKQLKILQKARQALRPDGKLIVREAAKAPGQAHRHTKAWEIYATKAGLNQTTEGLHFRTLDELQADFQRAGFEEIQLVPEATKNANVLLVASTPPPQSRPTARGPQPS